jgi:hypothetical protein
VRSFVARRPRHRPTREDGLPVTVHPTGAEDETVDGRLKNLSRDGFQLTMPTAYELGQQIAFRLSDPQTQYEFDVEGTVRWSTENPSGEHTVGCQATAAIDWSTLGELFLRRMLDDRGESD